MMAVRNIPTEALALAIGCSRADLHNWRRAGFLADFGERKGKATVYGLEEAVRVYVFATIGRCGLGFANAHEIVAERIDHITTAVAGLDQGPDHFLTITLDPAQRGGYSGVTRAPLDRVNLTDAVAAVAHLQLNISECARRVLSAVRAFEAGKIVDEPAEAEA